MHSPNPPLGLAYIAAAIKDAGFPYQVIDGTGEALDVVRPYADRDDFMIQGLSFDEITTRIHPDTDVIGVACMFSTLWPLVNKLAWAVREKFPDAWMILAASTVPRCPRTCSGRAPSTRWCWARGRTRCWSCSAQGGGPASGAGQGIAFRDGDRVVKTGLSVRKKDVDAIAPPDWDSFPIEEYIARHQINGANMGRSMPLLATRGCPFQCTFCSNPACGPSAGSRASHGWWPTRWSSTSASTA